MTAATSDVVRDSWALPEVAPNECHKIHQNNVIFAGSVAMLVAGQARSLVAATASSTVLGVAIRQYAAPAGSDLSLLDGYQAIFRRGVFQFAGNPADFPTEAQIGQIVYFADDSTVQATAPGSPNLGGILRAITFDGPFWVEV